MPELHYYNKSVKGQNMQQAKTQMRRFASMSLVPQLAALAGEIPGVHAADDIECIHRMRVASRRLRTRLRLFADCLPAKRVRVWQQATRRITLALGEARDLDVQLAFLLDFLDALSDQLARPGVEAILHHLQATRTSRQHRVITALDDLEHSGVLPELHTFLAPYYVPESAAAGTPRPPELQHLLETTIAAQLSDLMRYDVYLAFPECAEQHHAMRIAAKHLRYTLETFTPLLGERIKPTLKLMRALQDTLGDIHDCDVWAMLLSGDLLHKFIPPTDASIPGEWLPGIALLLRDRRAFREKRFAELLNLWQQQQQKNSWYALLQWVREGRESEIEWEHETADDAEVSR